MAPKIKLKRTQHWMQTVIMHPGSNEQAVASRKARALVSERLFPRLVLRSETLDSYQRIGIYRDMYLARLREALASDYPGLLHYLGDEAFTALVTAYVHAHPSRSYTLNRLGDHLPEYIRSAKGLPRPKFLFDLARLELAMSQLFDASESPVLKPCDIADVSAEAWETAQLKPIDAFRLLAFDYPVSAYLASVRDGTPHPSTRRKNSCVVIFRQNYTLQRLDLTRPAYELLSSLASGVPLGRALSLASRRRAIGEVQLFSWFRDWVANGLFQTVEQSPLVRQRR
jgi:hypothetical protein